MNTAALQGKEGGEGSGGEQGINRGGGQSVTEELGNIQKKFGMSSFHFCILIYLWSSHVALQASKSDQINIVLKFSKNSFGGFLCYLYWQ